MIAYLAYISSFLHTLVDSVSVPQEKRYITDGKFGHQDLTHINMVAMGKTRM
jgi:hypothetical protein